MAGTAAKIIVSERQQVLLKEFSKSRTVGKSVSQRATIILLGFQGLFNEEIALRVGLNRQQVGLWRQRWRDTWDSLCVWECTEPHRLREAILDVLSDAPRPGAPATFTAEQVSQIVALACEPPKLSGRPIDHWTLRELRDEAIKRKIAGYRLRLLRQAAVQPHRKKMWLNTRRTPSSSRPRSKTFAEPTSRRRRRRWVELVSRTLQRGRGDLAAGHRAERPRQAGPTRQRTEAGI